MEYVELERLIAARGLRIVTVRGLPSPWSVAARAIFDWKQVPYLVAAQEPGGENEALEAWSGQRSAPVVCWEDERPIDRWLDILMLAERIAPARPLLPEDVGERARVIGLCHELAGENGLGWCRRLLLFQPAMESGSPPEGIRRMAACYGYSKAAVEAAPRRAAAILGELSRQLAAQRERGRRYLVGTQLSALDLYWVAFASLLEPLPDELCPMPPVWREAFRNRDPQIAAALDPALLEHRDRIAREAFRLPLAF